MAGSRNDAGLDAQLHATLEKLAQYVEVTALAQTDGSISVLMNGQTPLLVGEKQFQISVKPTVPQEPPPTYPEGRPPIHVFASDGADITAATTGGQLGALLDIRNRLLAGYLGDSHQAGDLNTMAKQFADRVNALLTSGIAVEAVPATPDSEEIPAVPGAPLFTYDIANDTNVAHTLEVVAGLAPSALGAISPGPPKVANGIPLALSALADPQQGADTIGGASFTEYYGTMAARVGHELNRANDEKQISQSAVAQAKDLRHQMSGVSLDEEAIILIQFQRAYEANSRFLSVLNQLTEDVINIFHP
jgi:flagellar hook-associated protein 1 FlgK